MNSLVNKIQKNFLNKYKKPKILPEQKEIINNFWNKHKNNAVKSEIKFFNKFI